MIGAAGFEHTTPTTPGTCWSLCLLTCERSQGSSTQPAQHSPDFCTTSATSGVQNDSNHPATTASLANGSEHTVVEDIFYNSVGSPILAISRGRRCKPHEARRKLKVRQQSALSAWFEPSLCFDDLERYWRSAGALAVPKRASLLRKQKDVHSGRVPDCAV